MKFAAALSALAAAALLAVPAAGQAAAPRLQFAKPRPPAPFSAAVRVDDILYLSGQIGTGADGRLVVGDTAQFRQTMDNIAAVLKDEGASMDDVFKCTVMLADMTKWADFNKVYVTYFKPDRLPSRSAFGAAGLVNGALVELECWAFAPRSGRQ